MVGEASVVPSLQIMPASYGYLSAMAKSIRNNPSWLAVAGVARGLVPYIGDLNTSRRLTNTIANSYQPRDDTSINAITNIRPYGLTIWGNRTLKHNIGNLTATSFLNTRNLISEVKKIAYITAKSLIFEQNTDVLWINFRAGITPLLDRMLSGQGLTNYKIIRKATTERAKVVAEIRLSPIDAVEDFDITVVITDDNISVS
jgi:phage tail sheath protein FI